MDNNEPNWESIFLSENEELIENCIQYWKYLKDFSAKLKRENPEQSETDLFNSTLEEQNWSLRDNDYSYELGNIISSKIEEVYSESLKELKAS